LGRAVLSACQGAAVSSHRVFAGTAPDLERRGIPAVVAMQYSILNTTARLFADEFYRTLALGWPVDAAIQMFIEVFRTSRAPDAPGALLSYSGHAAVHLTWPPAPHLVASGSLWQYNAGDTSNGWRTALISHIRTTEGAKSVGEVSMTSVRAFCPRCQSLQNLELTTSQREEVDSEGNVRKIVTKSYQCVSCRATLRSEDIELPRE
jgi:hypothetical protein